MRDRGRALPFADEAVRARFDTYPAAVRRRMDTLRALILDTAASTDGVGPLEETLRWGEPAYLTSASGSGSTIRLDAKPDGRGRCAIYFNCRTTLVDTFRSLFPNELRFEGNRAIVFEPGDPLPEDAIAWCVAAALTYHRRKAAQRAR